MPPEGLQPADQALQGNLAGKKPHRPETLPWAYALSPRVVLGEWVLSYERGTHVLRMMHCTVRIAVKWLTRLYTG